MKYLYILLLSNFFISNAQMGKIQKLERINSKEVDMIIYEKDSTAKALVLEEIGHQYIDQDNDYKFRRDIYRRVKIFDKSEVDRATITINLYKDEEVKNIKAISYTSSEGILRKTFLSNKRVYKKQLSENWSQTNFTLPNVKEGSVIEYTYSVISPYYKLDDWKFQSDIPKVKSDFTATILGNWKYNMRLHSFKPLDRKSSHIKRDCIYTPNGLKGDCLVSSFGLDHIPAFKPEKYMLAEKNFKVRIIFEPISYTTINGVVKKYAKTWKDADKTLKRNFFDGQTSKKRYFKRNLPQHLLKIKGNLERANAIYKHIQQELNWNNKYWTSDKLKIRNIYEEKTGGVDGINLSLYNALKAANIESYLVVLSTRQNGALTKLYPSTSEFNYVIVKAVIDGKNYYLDATDKNLFFGEIPYRCLNGEGRVLDFDKGSYWELIKPKFNSSISHNINLEFEENELKAKIVTSRRGYYSLSERIKTNDKSEDEYLENFETRYPDLEVVDFNAIPSTNGKESFKSFFDVTIPDVTQENTIRFNPFLIDRIKENPFKLKERNYPVDFGYAISKTHIITLKIPKGYSIINVPKSKALSLPNKGGKIITSVKSDENQIKIYSKLFLSKAVYSPQEYYYLKELYKQMINVQNNYIELKKS